MDGNPKFDEMAMAFGTLWGGIAGALDLAAPILETPGGGTVPLGTLLGGTFRSWMTDEISDRFCESPMEELYYKRRMANSDVGMGLIPQYQIGPYRVDFAIPKHKQVIEIDGREFHTEPEDVAKDHERDRELIALGWTVERITGAQVNAMR